jgi:hypothetical protein
MHKRIKIYEYIPMILAAFVLFNCVALPEKTGGKIIVEETVVVEDQAAPVSFSEITNIVWELYEIRVSYGKTELNRKAMADNGLGDIFILQFMEEGINGKAAPNRYFGTYEFMHDHDFRLRPIISTLMAADINIGGLMENEYYWHLQRTVRWEIINNGLELYTGSPNEDITLRFLPQAAY